MRYGVNFWGYVYGVVVIYFYTVDKQLSKSVIRIAIESFWTLTLQLKKNCVRSSYDRVTCSKHAQRALNRLKSVRGKQFSTNKRQCLKVTVLQWRPRSRIIATTHTWKTLKCLIYRTYPVCCLKIRRKRIISPFTYASNIQPENNNTFVDQNLLHSYSSSSASFRLLPF